MLVGVGGGYIVDFTAPVAGSSSSTELLSKVEIRLSVILLFMLSVHVNALLSAVTVGCEMK